MNNKINFVIGLEDKFKNYILKDAVIPSKNIK